MKSFSISGCAGREEISTIFGFHPFFFLSPAFFCWPAPPAFGWIAICRRRRDLGRGSVAIRLSFRPSGDLVLVFVFSGRWFDALLFQVSGRPGRLAVGPCCFSSASVWFGRIISDGPFSGASRSISFFAREPKSLRHPAKFCWELRRCYVFHFFLFFQRSARTFPLG